MAYSYLLYRQSNKPWCGSFFHTSNPITFSFSCPFIIMDCSMMPFFCLHAQEGCCLKSRPSRGSTVRPFYDTITKRFLLTRSSRGAILMHFKFNSAANPPNKLNKKHDSENDDKNDFTILSYVHQKLVKRHAPSVAIKNKHSQHLTKQNYKRWKHYRNCL